MNTGRDEDALTRGLDELDAIRRRVVNVVGHALRTPVTTIAGMANALGTADDEATRTMLVDGLTRNARRLEGLLDDLLLAASVSTALPAGDPETVALRPAFDAAWRSIDGTGDLTVLGPDVEALVRPESIERIARAVLDNALKYGHGPIDVTCQTTVSGVHVEVTSIGDRPSEEEVQRAFELFYRGEHAVMAAPGLGVGLSVARELARAEGGEVGLERRGDAIVATVDLPT
ncbi:MAG: two-component system, OmpR family, phosphate regulon sensor histidine kinase PhoR [Acidimicrobiaceae bacterium]|jgi:signal transduction histidine kinase